MTLMMPRQRHLPLIVLCISLLIGCTARPQQVSSPSASSTPTIQASSPEPSPQTVRGLKGVIPGPSVIIPGRSVGPLQLGDTRERALELFGEPTEEYAYDENSLGRCKLTEMHWNDLIYNDRWGIFIYLRNNRIYQIFADTPRYATAAGITSDSSPQNVRRNHLTLQSYVLMHSGSKVNGGRDLIYWVDRSTGIAFEFYYHRSLDTRRVASIIVFEPDVEFLPKGCIEIPQEWRELKPFASELPSN